MNNQEDNGERKVPFPLTAPVFLPSRERKSPFPHTAHHSEGRRPTDGGRLCRAGEYFPPSPGGAGGVKDSSAPLGRMLQQKRDSSLLSLFCGA